MRFWRRSRFRSWCRCGIAIRRAEQVPDATRLAVLAQAGIPHEVQEQDEIPFGLWRLSAALFSVSLPEQSACVLLFQRVFLFFVRDLAVIPSGMALFWIQEHSWIRFVLEHFAIQSEEGACSRLCSGSVGAVRLSGAVRVACALWDSAAASSLFCRSSPGRCSGPRRFGSLRVSRAAGAVAPVFRAASSRSRHRQRVRMSAVCLCVGSTVSSRGLNMLLLHRSRAPCDAPLIAVLSTGDGS